ncbi:hypothetical protein ADICYQ_4549 [Cyclobacterium qasimii M12-11B]|uniref:Uncharacterized protein n=2 Tax=Cyclobacterium qasimii TaxID=1350429 RepID=S7V811_9BACT|nr:hypothetical protein ADICYQ_4549 [Cyclobacterium qasimii M12-11B]GEO21131.1 hypothetical protein CQA01_16650 [Cyclobacterium qasimii]
MRIPYFQFDKQLGEIMPTHRVFQPTVNSLNMARFVELSAKNKSKV